MVCKIFGGAIVCYDLRHRLRTSDGRYFYIKWDNMFGPVSVCHDRELKREIKNWWTDNEICNAIEWFDKRGERG